jgi:hypothetical protein
VSASIVSTVSLFEMPLEVRMFSLILFKWSALSIKEFFKADFSRLSRKDTCSCVDAKSSSSSLSFSFLIFLLTHLVMSLLGSKIISESSETSSELRLVALEARLLDEDEIEVEEIGVD